MKKSIATIVTLVVLCMAALPVAAQTQGRCINRSTNSGRTDARYRDTGYRNEAYQTQTYGNDPYNDAVYSDDYYPYDQNRSVWDRHRDKITTAGGAVGGALLGSLLGGKKGAIIGAITGGAGAAVYTYKIRDKYNQY
jgi:hypothetical protein